MRVLDQAEKARLANRYQEALKYYREALDASPDNSIAVGAAAYCLYNLSQKQEALRMAERAILLSPDLPIPHVVLANIFEDRGDTPHSREEIDRALRLDPNSAEALCCYGTLLLEDNEVDKATQYLTRAIEIQPAMYLAHYNLAVCYQRKADTSRYRSQIMKIFQLKPNLVNLIRLLVAQLATNPLLLAIVLLLPAVLFIAKVRVFILVHVLLLIVYVAAGILMIRDKQVAVAYRNFAIALFLALLDALLLIGFS